MKYIYLKILTILCLLCTICYSQSTITWQRLFDGGYNEDDYFYGTCKTTDGNYVLGGYSTYVGAMALKINNYGDTLWLRHFTSVAGRVIATTRDGGCILGSAGLLKITSSGDSSWLQGYSNTGVNNLYDLMLCSDGGYLACGRAYYDSGYVAKTDSLGSLLWFHIISNQSLTVRMSTVSETYSNGYLIGGYTYGFSIPVRVIMVKYTTNGYFVWEKIFDIGDFGGRALRIFKVPPYYVVASQNGLLKFDDSGNVMSYKIFAHDTITSMEDMQMINNNRFVAVTNSTAPSFVTSGLLLIDSSCNILRSKSIDFSDFVRLKKIEQTTTHDFIFTGDASPDNNSPLNFYAIRCDTDFVFPPIKVNNFSERLPLKMKLFQNYPNPFNGSTTITFDINQTDTYKLTIYDVLGRLIDVLFSGKLNSGKYYIKYDPVNISTGIYFYQLNSTDNSISKKIIITK